MANELTIYVPQSAKLPDTKTHVNRFEVKSESSGHIYIVAQSRTGRWWSCGCRGWIRHKHCKHLACNQLPGNFIPKNVIVEAKS